MPAESISPLPPSRANLPRQPGSSGRGPSSKLRSLLQSTVVMLRQWWDTDYHPEGVQAVRAKEDKVAIARTIPFIILHLGCLLVFVVGFSWFALGVAVALYLVRMFAITAFYHRYFSHRAFRTSRFMQFIIACWGNASMQRGPLWWASVHRHHHQHSDEEADVHSPVHHGFMWSHIGWITSQRNFPTDYDRVKDLAKFPELRFLNRHDQIVPLAVLGLLYLAGWLLETYVPSLGTNGWQLVVWGGIVSTVALMHGTFCINSLAHVFGRRRFATTDDSRNSLLLAIVTLGEGWHNNHHRYMHAARQGFYWWELDITYYILRVFAWCGLIWDLKPVPSQVYAEASIRKPSSGASTH